MPNSKKILYVANINQHIIRFHLPYLKWFQENGYETHVAANGVEPIKYCNVAHNIPVQRTPFSIKNIRAHFALKKIISQNNFDLVIGNTSLGGMVARTASYQSRKKGTKVIYIAHGLKFNKGTSLISWFFYYPIEKFLSILTDAIVTINNDDYQLLLDKHFYCKNIYKINGIGVDNSRFKKRDLALLPMVREEIGYNVNQFILVYTAEFIERKNHKFIINAANELFKIIPNIKILFLGRGILLESLKLYAKKVDQYSVIDFLGFRNDVEKILSVSDIGISSSSLEGLAINVIEEMFVGLPVVISRVKGHTELVKSDKNGFLFELNNQKQFIEYIYKLYSDNNLRLKFGEESFNHAQQFSLNNSVDSMGEIFKNHL